MTKKVNVAKKKKASRKQVSTEDTDTIDPAQELQKSLLALRVLADARMKDGINTHGLQEGDLLCSYDIRLTDAAGTEIVKNSGVLTLSGIGDKEALPEAPSILETIFRTTIWRPARNRFMRWLNVKIDSARPLPELQEQSYAPELPAPPAGGPLGG